MLKLNKRRKATNTHCENERFLRPVRMSSASLAFQYGSYRCNHDHLDRPVNRRTPPHVGGQPPDSAQLVFTTANQLFSFSSLGRYLPTLFRITYCGDD